MKRERGDEMNWSILYLMKSKNKHTKKDLRLVYSQGNLTAYPPTIKGMARYLSTQYPNKKPANQPNGSKRDKKKGDTPKCNNKDSNKGGTANAHVEDTTTTEKSIAPSKGANRPSHFLETNEQLSCPSRTIEEILEAQTMNKNYFWGGTNPSDMFIDTTDCTEMMTGSHITELNIHIYK